MARKRLTPLTDEQIEQLIQLPKPIPGNFKQWLNPRKSDHRHYVTSHEIAVGGHRFGVYSRIKRDDHNDFSVGLTYLRDRRKPIGLVRCNGYQTEHINRLERGTNSYSIPPNTPHVHLASARYLRIARNNLQKIGFAMPTKEYTKFAEALQYFVSTFGFVSTRTGKPFPKQTRIPFSSPGETPQ